MNRNKLQGLALSLMLCQSTIPMVAASVDVPERLAQETDQLEAILQTQRQYEDGEATLAQDLERNRQLRQMWREARLLTELNIAWIQDQVENWDCRIAEQKVVEVRSRIAEIQAHQNRIDALCEGADGTSFQQSVCQRHRSEAATTLKQFATLEARYGTECAGEGTK